MTSPSKQQAFPAHGFPGMFLRDYFAAKAMQALIQRDERDIAWEAYRFADEMLKARDAAQ